MKAKYISRFAKLLIFFLCSLSAFTAFAQPQEPVEMADALRSNGKIYVVVTCVAVIFTGLLIFLIMMERKVKRLEDQLNNK